MLEVLNQQTTIYRGYISQGNTPHTKNIPYLIIGRQTVIQYNAPLMTADYDIWVAPEYKKEFLTFLKAKKEFEIPHEEKWNKPIITVYSGTEKLDFFFLKRIINRDGEILTFEKCFERAIIKKDKKSSFQIRIPSIDDLIALKKQEVYQSKMRKI